MLKPGDTIEGSDPRECPFCFGKLYVVVGGGGLIHVVPTCETFDRMEPEDFAAAAARRVRLDVVLSKLGYRRVTFFDMLPEFKGDPICARCISLIASLGVVRTMGELLRPCRVCETPTRGQLTSPERKEEASKWTGQN